jgi:hypothetical protein
MIKKMITLALATNIAAFAWPAHASLLTDPADIANSYVVNFDGVTHYGAANQVMITADTIQIGFSTEGGDGLLGEAPLGAWGLDSNGVWSLGKTFAGVDGDFTSGGAAASMTFDFGNAKVAQVGAFVNFSPDYSYDAGPFGTLPLPLYIAALDSLGNVIDSYELPTWTPGGTNDGAFYGFNHASADIAKFIISGPYAVADNLTFSTPIDEPTAFALALCALALLCYGRARADAHN